MCLEGGRLTKQPCTEIEDATVTDPGVVLKGDKVERCKIIQEPVWEAGQLVVVQIELGGP